MSISRQNLTIIIVTFKSNHVLHECIESIGGLIKIIVIDNSNDKEFKKDIETKYNNVRCILSEKNVGMGAGNNLGIKHIDTNYAFILNPDVILDSDTIDEIIESTKKIDSFAVVAPIEKNENFPNFKLDRKKKQLFNDVNPFKVQSVDGYAMLLNVERLSKLENFKKNNFFDENFFMYLENEDFCKRIIDLNEKIFIVPKSKIKHLGGKAVDQKYKEEVELSRNWHWIWSKFYFNKKHHGFFIALINGLPTFFSAVFKFLLYSITNDRIQKNIYLKRISGFLNALLGKKSFYRPKVKD